MFLSIRVNKTTPRTQIIQAHLLHLSSWSVWPSGLVHWTLDVARMWVRIPAWPVAALVSLSKTLNHNCFVLWMGRKAVGVMCCVMHVKEPRTLIVKEKGLAPVFLDSRLEHPAGWIRARYKSYHYYYYMVTTSKEMKLMFNTYTFYFLLLIAQREGYVGKTYIL